METPQTNGDVLPDRDRLDLRVDGKYYRRKNESESEISTRVPGVSCRSSVCAPSSCNVRLCLPGIMDSEGRVDGSRLRTYIFKNGGVFPSERGQVWRFLFDVYPCGSTMSERSLLHEQLAVRYHVMKRKWQQLLPAAVCMRLNGTDAELVAAVRYFEQRKEKVKQQCENQSQELREILSFLELQAQVMLERVSFDLEELQEAVRIIDKDVPRTDRNLDYYLGEGSSNLLVLREILITFAAFHPELEAELLKELDPQLHAHLVTDSMDKLTFCHRWLLLGFQREFEHIDALRLFEILSCNHLELISQQVEKAWYQERLACKYSLENKPVLERTGINQEFTFELFICATILLEHRETLLKCQNESQLIHFANSLQGMLDLNYTLKKAEEHVYNYCKRSACDPWNGPYQPVKNKEEPFIQHLRSFFS
ncbi:uncharacterized protein [Paramormyrops kingsleyae]|uniref:uncharacterized protein isoform X2 n=1 Tax=Paramormyrops kingsleyae TaxID=1676925 RepID=UPI003B96F14E